MRQMYPTFLSNFQPPKCMEHNWKQTKVYITSDREG